MSLPQYLNCQSEEIIHCDFYMHRDCKNTCAYALDIRGLGVGAMMVPARSSKKSIDNKVDMETLGEYFE